MHFAELGWRQMTQVRAFGNRLSQYAANHPVFDHVTERRGNIAMVEMKEERRCLASDSSVGDADVQDRLRFPRHSGPNSDSLENAMRGMSNGRAAAVERLIFALLGRVAVEHDHV